MKWMFSKICVVRIEGGFIACVKDLRLPYWVGPTAPRIFTQIQFDQMAPELNEEPNQNVPKDYNGKITQTLHIFPFLDIMYTPLPDDRRHSKCGPECPSPM